MQTAAIALPIRWSERGASDKWMCRLGDAGGCSRPEFVTSACGAASPPCDPPESLDRRNRRAEYRNAHLVSTRKFGVLFVMTFVRLALTSLSIIRPSSRGGALAHG